MDGELNIWSRLYRYIFLFIVLEPRSLSPSEPCYLFIHMRFVCIRLKPLYLLSMNRWPCYLLICAYVYFSVLPLYLLVLRTNNSWYPCTYLFAYAWLLLIPLYLLVYDIWDAIIMRPDGDRYYLCAHCNCLTTTKYPYAYAYICCHIAAWEECIFLQCFLGVNYDDRML